MDKKYEEIRIMSLNVNGIGNPVKRAKIMTKIKKEKTQITFLQETHLSQVEHEKLKRFGFKNTYYSSNPNTRKRGVAILISNGIKFECQKEIKDKEGRYIIIRGTIGQVMLTLVNIYAPPESDKNFYQSLLDIIAEETAGICICGGDLNLIMDYDLDTTSIKRNKKSISKLVKKTHGKKWASLMYGETYIPYIEIIVITRKHTQCIPESITFSCRKKIGK